MSNYDASNGAAMYDTMPMGGGDPWDRQSGELQEKWSDEFRKRKKPKRLRLQKIVVWGSLFLFALVTVVNVLALFFKEAEVQVFSMEISLLGMRDFMNQYLLQGPGDLLTKIPLEKIEHLGLRSRIFLGAPALTIIDISACGFIIFGVWRRFKLSDTDSSLKILIGTSGLVKILTGILFVLLLFWKSSYPEEFSWISDSARVLYYAYAFCTLLFFIYLCTGILQNKRFLKWFKLIFWLFYLCLNTTQGVLYYQKSVDILSPAGTIFSSSKMEDPPSNIEDLCAIFEEKPRWYKHVKAAAKEHHIKIPVIMAIMHVESRFKPNENNKLRPENTAYGYPQAIASTWQTYQKDQKKPHAERSKFDDSVDFIAWLTRKHINSHALTFNVSDTYYLYLLYHEGDSRYRKGAWKKDENLQKTAAAVQKQATRYADQLKGCKGPEWYNG